MFTFWIAPLSVVSPLKLMYLPGEITILSLSVIFDGISGDTLPSTLVPAILGVTALVDVITNVLSVLLDTVNAVLFISAVSSEPLTVTESPFANP